MIAYVDSSVILRIVLQAPNPLAEWNELRDVVSSELLTVEGFRTFDRLWHNNELSEEELADKQSRFREFLRRCSVQPLDGKVLEIAAQSLPTPLSTLDAIHLATATIVRASRHDDERPLFFATHDKQLATAARALNFEVIGT